MSEKIGWYACAFMDLLGQKSELDQLNDFDEGSISENKAEINRIFQKTYGNIKKFKEASKDSVMFFNGKMDTNISNLKLSEFSDLIALNVSLSKEDGTGAVNMEGVYFLLLTTIYLFFHMLSKGIPLRGGIEIGLGIGTGDSVYGQSLNKAYFLESKKADSIRVIVGKDLILFIDKALEEVNEEDKRYAELIQKLITKDEELHILHYLSEDLRSLSAFNDLYNQAKSFLEKQQGLFFDEPKVQKKYSKALQYFQENPPISSR